MRPIAIATGLFKVQPKKKKKQQKKKQFFLIKQDSYGEIYLKFV